jgi:hypothetical protein
VAEEESLKLRKAIYFKHKNAHSKVLEEQKKVRYNKGKHVFLTPAQVHQFSQRMNL